MSIMYLNLIISNVAYINWISILAYPTCAESQCNQYCHELVVEAAVFFLSHEDIEIKFINYFI